MPSIETSFGLKKWTSCDRIQSFNWNGLDNLSALQRPVRAMLRKRTLGLQIRDNEHLSYVGANGTMIHGTFMITLASIHETSDGSAFSVG